MDPEPEPDPGPGQVPQSDAQLLHVSPASQIPLPHMGPLEPEPEPDPGPGQVPQSDAQLLQVSPASQNPLPHAVLSQISQSAGQLEQVSFGGSHQPSPQVATAVSVG
jgi:hypothetical protein